MFTVIYFSFFSFFLFLFLFACFVGNEERLTLIDTVLYSFTATNKGKHPVSSHVQERANWRICCFRQHPIESLVNPDWLSSCPLLARCQLWLGFPIQNTFIAMSCVLPKSCCYIPAKFLRSPVLPTVQYVSSRKKTPYRTWHRRCDYPALYSMGSQYTELQWCDYNYKTEAVMWAHAPRMNLQNTAPSPQSALFTLCRSVYKQPDSLTARGGSHYPI